MRSSSWRPSQPTARPAAAPPISCSTTCPVPASSEVLPQASDDAMTTSTATGASFSPDSASSAAATRLRSGSRRSTENTAEASVEPITAARITAVRSSSPSTRWAKAVTTPMVTPTPTVASARA
jgi:hypothetical protein